MKSIYKPLSLTVFALVVLALTSLSPASALFHCADCDSPSTPGLCLGVCNGQIARSCNDWYAYGCTGLGFMTDPIEFLFLPSFFLPSYADQAFTPADGSFAGESCWIPVSAE